MCPRTWVPCALEDAHPPRTPLGPQAQAYGGVLGGCVFLQVRSSCTCRVLGGRCFLCARYPCSLFFSHARRPVAAPTRTPVCSQRFLSHTSPPPVRPYSSPTCMPRNLWWGMGVSYERGYPCTPQCARTPSYRRRRTLISQNVYINQFLKVNSPTKSSTYCLLLLVKTIW